MHEYLIVVKDLANHLSIIGEVVPRKDLIMYIRKGLGSNYCGFVTSLNMRSSKPNFYELQSMLMREEQLNFNQEKFDEQQVLRDNFAKLNIKGTYTSSVASGADSSQQSSFWNLHQFL